MELQTGAAYLNQYKATQKFMKEMLPVGSVIYIAGTMGSIEKQHFVRIQ